MATIIVIKKKDWLGRGVQLNAPILPFIVLLTFLTPSLFAHQGGKEVVGPSALGGSKEETESRLPQDYRVIKTQVPGSLSGTVRMLAPYQNGTGLGVRPVKEALVYLKGVAQGKGFPVIGPLVLDQRGETFIPHVMVIPVGATVELRNSDSEMHNLHSFSVKNSSFNEGISEGGASLFKKFDMAEVVRLGCDIHKEMQAWIVVRDNPYYALTGEDGHFNIDEIPPGTYKLLLWHEDLDKKEQASLITEITIKPNATLEVDFYLTPKE